MSYLRPSWIDAGTSLEWGAVSFALCLCLAPLIASFAEEEELDVKVEVEAGSVLDAKSPRDFEIKNPALRVWLPGSNLKFAYSSLADADNKTIAEYMGVGERVKSPILQDKCVIPPNFWSMNPKDAAVDLVMTNGGVDVGSSAKTCGTPPGLTAVRLFTCSSPSYIYRISARELLLDSDRAYFIHAGSKRVGNVFYDFSCDEMQYDLRILQINRSDAQHIAETIWWMSGGGKPPPVIKNVPTPSCSSDGKGSMTLLNSEGTLFSLEGRVWGGFPISSRWNGIVDDVAALNFTDALFYKELPRRLGGSWKKLEPSFTPSPLKSLIGEMAPSPSKEETARLHDTAKTLLEWSLTTPPRVGPGVSFFAVCCAGAQGFNDLAPLLNDLRALHPLTEDEAAGKSPSGKRWNERLMDEREGWIVVSRMIPDALDMLAAHNDVLRLAEWIRTKTQPGNMVVITSAPSRLPPLRRGARLDGCRRERSQTGNSIRHLAQS